MPVPTEIRHDQIEPPISLFPAGDLRGNETRSEPVVNVDHGHAARARGEHREKGGKATKSRAVSDTGRDSNDGCADETRDDARKGALHPRHDDDRARSLETGPVRKDAVKTRDTHVVAPSDRSAHDLGRDRSFLGDGNIRGSGSDDHDLFRGQPGMRAFQAALRRVLSASFPHQGGTTSFCRPEDDHPGDLVPFSRAMAPLDRLELLGRRPGDQNRLTSLGDAGDDPRALLDRLSLPVHDLWKPSSQMAVVIETSVAEVLERERAQSRECLGHGGLPGGHGAQQLFDGVRGHGRDEYKLRFCIRCLGYTPHLRHARLTCGRSFRGSGITTAASPRQPRTRRGFFEGTVRDAIPEVLDAIVVGGGPSGSAAAYRLAARGCSVLVLEKTEMPRPKLCGGAISEQALEYLDFSIPPELHEWECFGARVHFGGEAVEVRSEARVAVFVSRAQFDKYLLDQSVAKGASVRFETVRGVEVRDDRVIAETDSGRHEARLAIIANGAASLLARLVRPKDEPSEAGYCLEQIDPRRDPDPFSQLGGLVDVHFGVSGFGYGWVFPHGEHYSIGVGGLGALFPDPRGAMRRFWVEECGLPADGLRPKGWPIPCGGIRRRVVANRLILAGDAAGFVDAFNGEGIAYAIRSGQQAAEIAKLALASGDTSERSLARSAERHYSGIETSLRYSLRLARLMHSYPSLFIRLLTTEPTILGQYLRVIQNRISYRGFFFWLLSRFPLFAVRLVSRSGRAVGQVRVHP